MNYIQNLQISMFGNYESINPKTDIIIKLLMALKDEQLVPGSLPTATFDLKTGQMGVDNRLQLLSEDKTWNIAFLADRIDFNYICQPETKKHSNLGELITYGNNLINKVFSVFPDTTGNRMAVNCNLSIEDMNQSDLKQFCSRFIKPIETLESDNYVEWSVMHNIRDEFTVAEDVKEQCNRIIQLEQIERIDPSTQPIKLFYDVVLKIDINTLAISFLQRFKYNNLLIFSNGTREFIEKICREIEGV